MVSVVEQRKDLLMQTFISQLVKDESGTTAIEYGLIGALITVVCIGGMTLVGAQLQGVYNAVTTAITPAL
jgi:pilus assembly protein Flp/PilA